jgi:hypothetical protein
MPRGRADPAIRRLRTVCAGNVQAPRKSYQRQQSPTKGAVPFHAKKEEIGWPSHEELARLLATEFNDGSAGFFNAV